MPSITETMSQDHRRCDQCFSESERLISEGEWSAGEAAFGSFRESAEHHFASEEDLLFPAFEERTGHAMGPTQVMRMEHRQMRQLFADMEKAAADRDGERYLGLSETLMMIMQQHNMKEEQMLYPMMDQALGEEGEQLLREMSHS